MVRHRYHYGVLCGVALWFAWVLVVPEAALPSDGCSLGSTPTVSQSASPLRFNELSHAQMDVVVDFSRLAEAVYHPTFERFTGVTRIVWDRIAHTDFENGGSRWQKVFNSGLKWDLFEGRSASGERVRVVAFAGTDTKGLRNLAHDVATDIEQVRSFENLPAQYWQALVIAKQIIEATSREPGVKLYFTGHSLGGGLAQFVALVNQVQAVVFNSAGLGFQASLQNIFSRAHRDAAKRNVLNIIMEKEPVHPIGWQLGQVVKVASSSVASWRKATLHGLELMITTVAGERAKALQGVEVEASPSLFSGKSIGGVSIDPQVTFEPASLDGRREQILRRKRQ